jgi:hypothetical protein
VLQVPPEATTAQIERSYRRLADRRLRARWRPGRASRELAQINAAYGVLGYPERREDYDRRRAAAALEPVDGLTDQNLAPEPAISSYQRSPQQRLPRVEVGRPAGGRTLEALIILLVIGLAVFVGSIFAARSPIDLSFVQSASETLGLSARRRATPAPLPTALAAAEPLPSPGAATPTAAQPLGALPTALAGQRFSGSQVTVVPETPARRTDATVTVKLVREGQPVSGANVYLVIHYRTVDERQPPGTSTVRTDNDGLASVTFNIGDATGGYPVKIDAIALVEGQQVVFPASFTPR